MPVSPAVTVALSQHRARRRAIGPTGPGIRVPRPAVNVTRVRVTVAAAGPGSQHGVKVTVSTP
jgi:hypothetical protein